MNGDVEDRYMALIADKVSQVLEPMTFPPPVYVSMKGKILEFDLKAATLKIDFLF